MYLIISMCGVVTVLLVILCETEANTTVNNCVSDYEEFEEKTFSNKGNRCKLYGVFYPSNRHLPYVVDVTYQAVLPNGTEYDITLMMVIVPLFSGGAWISSPLFLFFEPEVWNTVVLYTLNYFRPWTTPSVILHVLSPCKNTTVVFLARMTSLVHDYALGKQGSDTPSGNVVSGCADGKQFTHIPNLSGKTLKKSNIIEFVVTYIGGLCTMILVSLWSVVVLKRHLEDRVKFSYTYSYNHYGFWWGVTILVFITLPLMLYSDESMLIERYNKHVSLMKYLYGFPAGILLLSILSGVPIAIYFVYKTKQPPAIPYILMIPVTVLFCCCNTKCAKLLVFAMALWINLVAQPLTAFHGVAILVTVIVEPFAVITNTLVLALFCLTNIFALSFTIFAYTFTRKHQRPQGEGTTMLRAIILILLLVVVGCIGIGIGVMGYLVNEDTKQGSFVSMASSASVPLVLGLVTFGLKKLISKWLDKAPNSNPLVGEALARVELLHSESMLIP